jgi:hypothetical protein
VKYYVQSFDGLVLAWFRSKAHAQFFVQAAHLTGAEIWETFEFQDVRL